MSKILRTSFLAVATIVLMTSSQAWADAKSDADAAETLAFQSFDTNGDGVLTTDEGENMMRTSWDAAVTDTSKGLTLTDFKVFSLGLLPVAEQYNKVDAYNKARGVIFVRWDTDKNGVLSGDEFRTATIKEVMAAAKAENMQGMKIDLAGFKNVQFAKEMNVAVTN